MSASQEKKRRLENRGEELEKLAAEKAAEKKKKSLKRVRNIVIAVLVVLAIAAIIVINSDVLFTRVPAVSVDGTSYSASEVNYLYRSVYYNYVNEQTSYASQYGMTEQEMLNAMGLDTSKPLDQQPYPMDMGKTWHDYFSEQAYLSLKELTALNNDAQHAGFTLPQEDQDAIDGNISQLELYAQLAGYSNTKQYLAAQYGKGVTENTVRKMMTLSMIGTRYAEQVQASFTYEESELEDWYQENKDAYDVISYCTHFFSGAVSADIEEPTEEQTAEAMAAAKKLADEMVSKVTDEASFDRLAAEYGGYDTENPASTRTEVMGSNITAAYSEWLLDSERKAGDVATIEGNDGYYAVMLVERDDNHYAMQQVRHILAKAEPDADGVVTEEAKAAAKAEAESILEEWKAGEATEESFAALATEYSDDPGSVDNGGLYDNVMKRAYVDEFEAFAFDSSRKSGDTGIVYGETTGENGYSGYHVMYYVGEGQFYSDYIAESTQRNADFESWKNTLVNSTKFEYGKGVKYVG